MERVPYIAVGYTGWKKTETLQEKVEDEWGVLAALIIDPPIFVWRKEWNGGGHAGGDYALWAMICMLHQMTTGIVAAAAEPFRYLRG